MLWIKTGDFYALTAGKSGPSVVGLEFVYGRVDNSNAFVSNSSDVNPTKDVTVYFHGDNYLALDGNTTILAFCNFFSIKLEEKTIIN